MSYFSHSCPPYRGDYKTRRDFKRAKDEWRKKCKDIPEYIRCDDCGGSQSWCSICECYTQNCCVDYGTCLCS